MRDSYILYKDKLKGEYKEAFGQIELYCSAQNIDELTQEEQLMQLLDVFLNAQEEGKPVKQITGSNMESFCKNFCSGFSIWNRLANLADYLKRIAWLLVVFTGFELIAELGLEEQEAASFWSLKTDIAGYLIGVATGLSMSCISGFFISRIMFRMKKISMTFLKGCNILLWIIVLVAVFFVQMEQELACPLWIVLLCSISYLLLYYIFRRKERKKERKIHFRDMVAAQLPAELVKRYHKENKKKVRRGLPEQSREAYLDKLEKECRRELVLDIFFYFFPVIITGISAIFVSFDTPQDRFWFVGIMLVVESLIMIPLTRFSQRAARRKLEWVEECRKNGYQFVEVQKTEEMEKAAVTETKEDNYDV